MKHTFTDHVLCRIGHLDGNCQVSTVCRRQGKLHYDVIEGYKDKSRGFVSYDTAKCNVSAGNLVAISNIYAYELMLSLHEFCETGPPRRVDCVKPPPVCHIDRGIS